MALPLSIGCFFYAFRNSVCVSSAVALRVLHQQFSRRSPSHLTRVGMEMGNHSGLAYVVVANICTWAKPLWYVVGHTHIVLFCLIILGIATGIYYLQCLNSYDERRKKTENVKKSHSSAFFIEMRPFVRGKRLRLVFITSHHTHSASLLVCFNGERCA